MAGVGDEQLSKLHVRSVAHPARDRDRGDSKSPQGDWLPDGVGRHSQPRAKLGGRKRGLLGPLVSREPLDRRLTPHACVEHLASHRRLADEGAGPAIATNWNEGVALFTGVRGRGILRSWALLVLLFVPSIYTRRRYV